MIQRELSNLNKFQKRRKRHHTVDISTRSSRYKIQISKRFKLVMKLFIAITKRLHQKNPLLSPEKRKIKLNFQLQRNAGNI